MKKYKLSKKEEAGMFFKVLLEGMSDKEKINVGLPGGRSIIPILHTLRDEIGRNLLSRCFFFMVDERVEGEKNVDTIRDNFFDAALKEGEVSEDQLLVPSFSGDPGKVEAELDYYSSLVPDRFDILVFGVGEDGHVGALYPGFPQLDSEKLVEYMEDSPKEPPKRSTMTFKAFNRDATVILLFLGEGKKEALKSFYEKDYSECPAAYFEDFEDLHVMTDLNVS